MQTFMPFSDFREVAKCLDNKRLGKQRVETWQIYQILQKIEERERLLRNFLREEIYATRYDLFHIAWEKHPIVKMWKRHEASLLLYGISICTEWRTVRKFQDTLFEKFNNELATHYSDSSLWKNPDWIYDEELQLSHQSNLVRKSPEHYRKYFPNIPENLKYKWVK